MTSYADLQYDAQYMSISNGNSQSRDVFESKEEFSQKNPGNFFNLHIILHTKKNPFDKETILCLRCEPPLTAGISCI